jgi:hypothetical protein
MTEMSGACLCGAVRFTAKNVETDCHACHCGMCRRWSGGPFLGASVGSIRFDGDENITRYNSSEWAERGSCRKCGSNLFYRVKAEDRYVLCVGAFDDPAPFRLVGEIYIDRKPAGYAFAGDLPQQTEAEVIAEWRRRSGDESVP